MANKKDQKPTDEQQQISSNKRLNGFLRRINTMIGQNSLSLYGTDRNSEIDKLDQRFYSIMSNEMDRLTNGDDADTTSFISKLYFSDRNNANKMTSLADSLSDSTGVGGGMSAFTSFLDTVYRNRLMEQSDLHQVASQLIELDEAINITRDAIISADVVEGTINRSIEFEGERDRDNDLIPIVTKMEEKFDLSNKLKNFIVRGSLEYGEYYVYTIPYSKLFQDFQRNKRRMINGNSNLPQAFESVNMYESVMHPKEPELMYEGCAFLESTQIKRQKMSGRTIKYGEAYIDSLFDIYMESVDENYKPSTETIHRNDMYAEPHDRFTSDMKAILERIEVCNDPTAAIPFTEEGLDSFEAYMETVYMEAKEADKEKDIQVQRKNMFDQVQSQGVEGIYNDKGKDIDTEKNEFEDIKDVYIKMMDPTKLIPVEIMDEVIGYYYVSASETTRLDGLISSNLDYQGMNGFGNTNVLVDSICDRIIRSFDKPFLIKNIKFKRLIVQAINYYNINNNRIRFQFIPVEYMDSFIIDQDVEGHGQSMIKKSLFYAKLYLMLLMFKMLSIFLYSNDRKVNYVKQSGLRKDVANKVQEIIRRNQSRTINMYDLYNYSSLINKVGSGNEMWVPQGKSGERPIETEILAGQDVQLNTEMMEHLKNAYILGTGVPAAIMNYLYEPQFAKLAEQDHSKFMSRCINYQLDYNPAITKWYKKILKWSTNIPEDKVNRFKYVLQPPKANTNSVKSEMLQNFNANFEFLTKLFLGEQADMADPANIKIVRNFQLKMIDEQLPMLNIHHIEKLFNEAKIEATRDVLAPNPASGDNGDDIDFGDLEKELK